MRRFFRDEPADDPLEARPPERPCTGARQHGAEMAAPDRDQLGYRIGRQLARKATHKFGKGLMDADAEIRSTGIGVQFVQGCQTQDMAGIDRVGIAEPGLDLGDRQLAWPRGKRWARRGRRRGSVFHSVEPVGDSQDRRIGPQRMVEAARAQHCVKAQQPARRHCRHPFAARGAGQRHFRGRD